VHRSILANLQKETAAGGRYSFRNGDQAIPSRVSKHCISVKPQEKPVQDANGKKDSTSYQEAPEGIRKASEDVSQPCCKTNQCKYLAHAIPL
jgi:hypothetical protein